MKSYKFGVTTCREVIDTASVFRVYLEKKTLKFAVLDLFGNISTEIWIKQKLHNTLRPLPLDGAHLVAVRGLIHQEVPECVNEESSTERHN